MDEPGVASTCGERVVALSSPKLLKTPVETPNGVITVCTARHYREASKLWHARHYLAVATHDRTPQYWIDKAGALLTGKGEP